MIKIPALTDNFQAVASLGAVAPPFDNVFYYVFTGCQPNAIVGEF